MKICPTCRAPMPDDGTFCIHDGTRLPESTDDLPGAVLDQRYQVLAVHQRGGFATVYRAQQRDEPPVALKVLHQERKQHPEIVARFQQEIAAGAALDHPHVVRVLGHGEDPVIGPWLALPLLQGETLLQRLDRAWPLPLPVVDAIVRGATAALHAAHEAGMVHRDVKAENLFLVEPDPPHVMLLDFGVARMQGSRRAISDALGVMTRPRQVVGSPLTMSPEQVLGEPIDARADVYSLGVVLFEVLTGQLPFEREQTGLVMKAHVHEPPPRPRDLQPWMPLALEAWLLGMLQKRPRERPASMLAVAAGWQAVRAEAERVWPRDA